MGLMVYGAISGSKMTPCLNSSTGVGALWVGIAVVIVAWLDLREVLKELGG